MPAQAQSGDNDRPLRKIEQFKKMKLLEVLDLDEAAANTFLAKYDKWEKQIIQLMQARSEMAMDMKIRLERKAPDSELTSLLDSLVETSKKYEDTKFAMFADMRSVLTPRQAVKFSLFEMQFQRKLHESIDKLRDHRGPF